MPFQFNKPVFRPSDLPTGLVGYWKFNNDATDSSGSGYNLTAINTPTYAVDDYWKSGEYSAGLASASTQKYEIADASCPNLSVTTAFTIHMLVKNTAVGAQYDYVIKDEGAGKRAYWFAKTAANVLFARLSSDGTAYTDFTGVTALSAGKWHFVSLTYDGDTVRIYLDGNLDLSTAYTSGVYNNAEKFSVGTNAASANYMNGRIKDLAVWNVALTPLQIKSLALGYDISKYAYRPNNVSTQPTAWWKLNEVSGNRADSIGALTLTDSNTVLASGGYTEGVSAYIEATNSESLYSADNTAFDFSGGIFSISAWVKKPAITTEGLWSNSTDGSNYAAIELLTGGAIRFVVVSGGSAVVDVNSTASFTAVNTWYHITVTESGDTWKIYLDGIDVTSTGGTDTQRCANYTGNFTIGTRTTAYLRGNVQDFAIWKGYALSAAEIKSLACALPVQRQGVVAYWKMNAATGANEPSYLGDTAKNILVPTSGTCDSAAGQIGTSRQTIAANTELLKCASADQSTDMRITTDMTWATWIYPVGAIAGDTKLAKMDTLQFHKAGSGTPYFSPNAISSANFSEPGANVWSHWVGCWDGANAIAYSNALVTETLAATAPTGSAADLEIGFFTPSTGSYANVRWDEMFLAKRYFRPEEIKAVYLKGLNAKEFNTSERSSFVPRAILI